MTKFLPFFILLACSHQPSSGNRTYFKNHPSAKVTKSVSSNEKEARNWIQNQLNFFHMLFEQSRDPYYGELKWSEQCLKENEIGKIEKKSHGIQMVSKLYLNPQGHPGFCSNSSESSRYLVIFAFCDEDANLTEIKIPWSEEAERRAKDFCF